MSCTFSPSRESKEAFQIAHKVSLISEGGFAGKSIFDSGVSLKKAMCRDSNGKLEWCEE